MPAIDPDDLPKKKITHEMGQDLTLLSVGELTSASAFSRRRSRGLKRKWQESALLKRQQMHFSRNSASGPPGGGGSAS